MIGAKVGNNVVAKTGDRPIVPATNLHRADLGAAVNRCLHVFAARLDPFDGLAQLDRDPTQQGLFRVDV
jgi:hypothetical protein